MRKMLGFFFWMTFAGSAAFAAVSYRPAPDGVPGAVLVTADADGEPRFDCVGEAAPGRRMEPDTVFWMASNTKGVFAALVLNLVSEGVLSLDDRVEKYIPSWEKLAVTNRPTLRMLLCHTAGLDVFPKKTIARPGMDALAEHVHVEPLKFEPDTDYLYSNWDIDIAAAIVEKVTGHPFEIEMTERILKPLGMTDSSFIPGASQSARRATFYRLSDGKPPKPEKIVRHKLAPPYKEVGVYPEAGGGLLSTPRDMIKFFQMIARGGRTPDGRVLISAPLMEKWATKQTPPCVKVGYSFGMKVDGKGSLSHGGVGGTWAEVNVKTRKARLYMANFQGQSKAAAAFKKAWKESTELTLADANATAVVWRGETAYVDLPAGAATAMLAQNGASKDGVEIRLAYYDDVAYEMKPDGEDMRSRPDVYREIPSGRTGAKTPTVCRITALPGAKPGVRRFGSFEVTVLDRVLPPAKDWKYFLDLWQHPWAVSRYFGVEPFSKEHYAKMEPIWRALAACGCKALTVTLLDLPWNHQCYDGYYSMIGRVKNADGSWTFDFKLFDDYVAFGRRCGLGPDIACYTMCPWRYRATWKDADGKDHREKILPGTPEFEAYWGPFLVDFAAHLKAKGWFEDAYIAMDERGPEDVKKIVDLIQAKAPGLKVAICGKTKPSAFDGIKIENFCQGLIHLRRDFIPELAPRRAKGYKTTFYVCASAKHPNTFMDSPPAEGFWLGAYPVMIGFDGFLRWAANSWPKDPYKDASFRTGSWKAGDTFLIYPGGELSSRLISLRAGVVAAEKMRILREAGVASEKDIQRLAAPYGYRGAVYNGFDFSAFRRDVEAFVNAHGCK